MARRILLVLSVIGLFALVTSIAAAAPNVIHDQLVFSETSTMDMDDDLAACVGYGGTVSEDRNYDIQVTEFVRGPRAGTVHLNGHVLGDLVIEPGPSETGPTYHGSYREKINFIGTSFDDPLVFTFSLPATAEGSDGSRLKILLHGHGVIDPDGEPRVLFFKFRCIQSGA